MISVADAPDPEKPETWLFQIIVFLKYRDAKAQELGQGNGNGYDDFQNIASLAKGDHAARTKWLKHTFSQEWCEPFRSTLAQIKDDSVIPDDPMSYWATPTPWPNHNGRVTLSGDSAHPMTPSRGQGLNNAIKDAAEYVQVMQSVRDVWEGGERQKNQKELVDAYDRDVLERGAVEIPLSLKQTLVITDFGQLLEGPLAKMGMYRPRDGVARM